MPKYGSVALSAAGSKGLAPKAGDWPKSRRLTLSKPAAGAAAGVLQRLLRAPTMMPLVARKPPTWILSLTAEPPKYRSPMMLEAPTLTPLSVKEKSPRQPGDGAYVTRPWRLA